MKKIRKNLATGCLHWECEINKGYKGCTYREHKVSALYQAVAAMREPFKLKEIFHFLEEAAW